MYKYKYIYVFLVFIILNYTFYSVRYFGEAFIDYIIIKIIKQSFLVMMAHITR